MPVKKAKKTVSSKKRKEIHEAANSIPGLIIEHVAFNKDEEPQEKERSNHKYMLSVDKQKEHQKKRFTVFVGVGTIMLVLCGLWFLNVKTFFFDSNYNISKEEQLLNTVKQNFDNTVGLVAGNKGATTTTNPEVLSKEHLKAALIAGLLVSSTPSSATSSATTTSTTSTPVMTTTSTTSTLNS